MININNTSWEKLDASDIEVLLSGTGDETFFFEFKSDDEEPAKLVKEISAFANTFGGYILIGINDDKTIGGCKKWTEQRIHTTVHDSLTPVPNFDVKKLIMSGNKIIFVIKIEEGTMPPYITNKGYIYERVSSGSFPIKESSKLTQLYRKREDQLEKVRNKIELSPIRFDKSTPENLCAYIDLGFSVTMSEKTYLQDHFYDYDLTEMNKLLEELDGFYHISRVGYSFIITSGGFTINSKHSTSTARIGNGIQNFIEIMCDGSVRCRAIIVGNNSDESADIATINIIGSFQQFYELLFRNDLPDKFIYAQKYQKLTVLKQFKAKSEIMEAMDNAKFNELYYGHIDKFGTPLIVEGNRLPTNDFYIIDKRFIEQSGREYNKDEILDLLFSCDYQFLGYMF